MLDDISFVVTVAGLAAGTALATITVRDWRRTHRRWAYRAMIMSIVVLIVWVGFAATYVGRVYPWTLDLAQPVAVGARLTLLALVVWLLAIHHRDPQG